MITSQTTYMINKALAAAQSEIENASKNAANQHFKSKYADLAEVLNVVRPVFSSHGIAIVQAPSYDCGVVSVATRLAHESGEWIQSTVAAPVSKQDAQGVGSAITYCRRYSLAAMAGIAQEDDDANSAVGNGNQQLKQQANKEELNAEFVKSINEAKSREELTAVWKSIPVGSRRLYQELVKTKGAEYAA